MELITAKNRDIACYKHLRNDHILHELISEGVKVYEVKEKYLHMKGLVFDDEAVTFGITYLFKDLSIWISGVGTTIMR